MNGTAQLPQLQVASWPSCGCRKPLARGCLWGICVSWIWSSWGLNTLTDILETCVLHIASSKSSKFHVPYSLQGLPVSHAIRVVELSWSRDVLSAGPQSTLHGLQWSWKVWAPPSLKSVCFHGTFTFLPVGVFSWKTSHWKSLSQWWHRARHSALSFPVFQEHLCTYQLKISPNL